MITIKHFITLILLALSSVLWAQDIQLLDADSQTPLVDVYYEYGNEKGISDTNGKIAITYNADESLFLSHLSYGSIILNPTAVLRATEAGNISMKMQTSSFQPVNVIAVHPPKGSSTNISLEYRDMLASDGASFLTSNPAVAVIRKSSAYAFDPVIRGMKYEQLNIVIDGGQCTIAACPNRMDTPSSQISLNDMESVEILKGPHSLRFGNSFGGTINFKSSRPQFTEKLSTFGRLSGEYESNGALFRTEAVAGIRTSKMEWRVFGAWSQGDDYIDGDGIAVPASFLRANIGSKLGLKINDHQEATLSFTRNIARDVEFVSLPMDLRTDDTWLFNGDYTISFDNKNLSSIKVNVYGSIVDHLMDNLLKTIDPRMVDASTFAKTNAYGGRAEGIWNLGNNHLYAGMDTRMEYAEGTRERSFLLGPNTGKTFTDNVWQGAHMQRSSLFGEYHINASSKTQYVISSRLEMNHAFADDIDEDFEAIYNIPESTQYNFGLSLGGIYQITPKHKIGIWAGRSKRSGSISERYINFFPVGLDPYELIGNPNLAPEKNNQLDIVWDYNNTNSRISVDVFAAYLQDFISSSIREDLSPKIPSSPGVRQFVNLDHALLSGFEVSWNQALRTALEHQLSCAYTYGQELDNKSPLPEIAPFDIRYALTAHMLKNKLQSHLSFRYVTAQERIAESFGEQASEAFQLIDLDFTYKMTNNISLRTGAKNLLDETYYEHLNRTVIGENPRAIYNPGRSLFFNFMISF